MEEIKISAKTLDEAKTQALLKLNTSSDHIEFKVLEEGSTGLLGFIGSKPWVISARVKSDDEIAAEVAAAAEDGAANAKEDEIIREVSQEAEAQVEDEPVSAPVKELHETEGKTSEAVKSAQEDIKEAVQEAETKVIAAVDEIEADASLQVAKIELQAEAIKEKIAPESTAEGEAEKEALEPVSEEEAAQLIAKGEEFLKSIFSVMDINADIRSEFDHDTNEIYYEFNGDDMGVLIGKRGQTLDSLQYLVSLVVNKHRNGYIRVKLDTENYRDRRKGKLEDLAHNIAQKVKRTRRKMELEPMNPYERRIIHSALQNDPYVTTISEGEEPYRHVVVLLKKDQNRRRYSGSSKNFSRDGGSRGYGDGNRGGRRSYNNRGYDNKESGSQES